MKYWLANIVFIFVIAGVCTTTGFLIYKLYQSSVSVTPIVDSPAVPDSYQNQPIGENG
jgi:hypothetical protein